MTDAIATEATGIDDDRAHPTMAGARAATAAEVAAAAKSITTLRLVATETASARIDMLVEIGGTATGIGATGEATDAETTEGTRMTGVAAATLSMTVAAVDENVTENLWTASGGTDVVVQHLPRRRENQHPT